MSMIRLSLIVLTTALVSAAISGSAVWFYLGSDSIDTQVLTPPVTDFALLDNSGRYHRLYNYKNAKAVVLYIYDDECPTAQHDLEQLKVLHANYADSGVIFLVINSRVSAPRRDSGKSDAQPTIDIPILEDRAQLVIDALDAKQSAEAFLLDTQTWQVRYRGPIHGEKLDPSATGQQASRPYLQNALAALLKDKPITAPVAKASGCFVEFEEHDRHREVSYSDEIVPILQSKCINCHRQGGIGPWAMDNYQTIKDWSARMREVILTNEMPPWHADPAIGKFTADRSLSKTEKRTLVHWIQTGAPIGAEDDPLAESPPAPPEAWLFGKPDLVIDLPIQEIPASGLIPYRWGQIEIPIKEDTWVRAVQFKPGNPKIIHHGFIFIKYPKQLEKDEPSWLEGLNGFFTAYVPGVNPLPFPEGSGQFLPKGSTLAYQLHYLSSGQPTTDHSRLALYFHDKAPAMEYKMASAANMNIRIPPNMDDHAETAEYVMEEDTFLHGMYPHMHLRGKRFQYELVYPNGSSEKILSVPYYDIDWQSFYRLEEPKVMPKGSRIRIDAAFDNSENNPLNPDPSQEVLWGLKSHDEMLVGYFMYTRKRRH